MERLALRRSSFGGELTVDPPEPAGEPSGFGSRKLIVGGEIGKGEGGSGSSGPSGDGSEGSGSVKDIEEEDKNNRAAFHDLIKRREEEERHQEPPVSGGSLPSSGGVGPREPFSSGFNSGFPRPIAVQAVPLSPKGGEELSGEVVGEKGSVTVSTTSTSTSTTTSTTTISGALESRDEGDGGVKTLTTSYPSTASSSSSALIPSMVEKAGGDDLEDSGRDGSSGGEGDEEKSDESPGGSLEEDGSGSGGEEGSGGEVVVADGASSSAEGAKGEKTVERAAHHEIERMLHQLVSAGRGGEWWTGDPKGEIFFVTDGEGIAQACSQKDWRSMRMLLNNVGIYCVGPQHNTHWPRFFQYLGPSSEEMPVEFSRGRLTPLPRRVKTGIPKSDPPDTRRWYSPYDGSMTPAIPLPRRAALPAAKERLSSLLKEHPPDPADERFGLPPASSGSSTGKRRRPGRPRRTPLGSVTIATQTTGPGGGLDMFAQLAARAAQELEAHNSHHGVGSKEGGGGLTGVKRARPEGGSSGGDSSGPDSDRSKENSHDDPGAGDGDDENRPAKMPRTGHH